MVSGGKSPGYLNAPKIVQMYCDLLQDMTDVAHCVLDRCDVCLWYETERKYPDPCDTCESASNWVWRGEEPDDDG